MTEQIHPMVPPNILLNNWESDWFDERQNVDVLLIEAYQAGADAELEACCEWMGNRTVVCPSDLRATRRPKPPSLKRVALLQLDTLNADLGLEGKGIDLSQIRRALEALPDD